MKTDAYQDNPPQVAPRRLWFGFTASTAAWILLGLADGLITWRACVGEEQWGGAHPAPGLFALMAVITFVLLGAAITGGMLCYRNWRRLSEQSRLADAEAIGRKEYVALIGLFMSVTLGVGIIWLGIPLIILKMCVRTR
jgi:hypothetical protein